MAVRSSTEQVTIGLQTGIGVTNATNHIVPVNTGSFSATETFENIMDTGRRGSEALDYNSFRGVGSTEITFEFPLMYGKASPVTTDGGGTGSVLGILLRNLLGTNIDQTGLGSATTATKAFALTLADGTTDTKAFGTYFRLANGTAYAQEFLTVGRKLEGTELDTKYFDCRVSEITISANAGEGPVTCSVTLTGQPFTKTAVTVNNKYFTQSDKIALGWENSLIDTVFPDGGSKILTPYLLGTAMYANSGTDAANRIISAEVTMTRESTPVYGLGNTNGFNNLYVGPLGVTFTSTAQLSNTELERVRAGMPLNDDLSGYTSSKTVFAFSSGDGDKTADAEETRAFAIGFSAVTTLEAPLTIDTSGSYSTLAISGRALATTASLPLSGDAYTGTGASSNLRRSPVEVLLVEEGNSTAASNRPNYGGAAT